MSDSPEELDEKGLEERKRKGWTKTVIYILVIIAGYFLLRNLLGFGFKHVKDAELQEFDEDTINSVLNSENSLDYPLPADTSPVVIEVGGTDLTNEQIISMTDAMFDRYGAVAAKIAEKLETDVQGVFDVTLIVAATAKGTMTQAGLDLYFRCLESWSSRWSNDLNSVSNAIAKIAEAQISGIDAATKCSETILVKEVIENTEQHSSEKYTVTIKNKSKGGFLGTNKRKSSSETRESIKEFSRVDNRVVRYVPVCIDWALEPTQFNAILAAGTLQSQMLYGLLTASLASAPSPSQFVKTK